MFKGNLLNVHNEVSKDKPEKAGRKRKEERGLNFHVPFVVVTLAEKHLFPPKVWISVSWNLIPMQYYPESGPLGNGISSLTKEAQGSLLIFSAMSEQSHKLPFIKHTSFGWHEQQTLPSQTSESLNSDQLISAMEKLST